MAGVKPKVNGEKIPRRGGRRARRKILPRIAVAAALGVLFFSAAPYAATTVAPPTTAVTPGAPTTSPGSSGYVNPYTPAAAGAAKAPSNPTDPPGSWEVYPSPTTANLYAVSFVDANDGWAVGYGTPGGVILHYQNGTWSVFKTYTGTEYRQFRDIDIVSRDDGWLVCFNGFAFQGEIWHWDGASWTLFDEPAGTLYCIDMISANDGWIGDNPGFLRFNGSNWVIDGYAPDHIYDIQMNSDNAGRALGGHYIMRRIGSAWVQEASDNTWNLGHIYMFDGGSGWAGGATISTEKGLILRYDGSWKVDTIFDDIMCIYGFFALTPDAVWTSGEVNLSPPYDGRILFFNGNSWLEVNNPDPDKNAYHDFCFLNENTGWAVGNHGEIIKYTPNINVNPTSLGKIKAVYR